MIDVTVPVDKNVFLKMFQKHSRYKDLEIDVIILWKLKTKIMPAVIGALDMIEKGPQNSIDHISAKPSLEEM